MSQIAIMDYFKIPLEEVKKLSVFEMKQIIKYLKNVERENKKAESKMKSQQRKHR